MAKVSERMLKKFNREIEKTQAWQKKHYPKANQLKLLNYLTDPEVGLLTSITTRGDGKTYGYFYALINLALKFPEFKFLVVTRATAARENLANTIEKILADDFGLKSQDIFIIPSLNYIDVQVHGESIALIGALDHAGKLKDASSVLKNYRLIVYDEFISVDDDYPVNEPERLKTIYRSVNRATQDPQILNTAKILLMGNPDENWSSPELSFFNLFKIMEKQPINSIQKHGNKVLERWRNEKNDTSDKFDLFDSEHDSSITGEVETNRELLASDDLLAFCKNEIAIKLDNSQYLVIHFQNKQKFYLELTFSRPKNYQYSENLADLKNGVKYLEDNYFNPIFSRKYERKQIRFLDNYTIHQFDGAERRLRDLNLNRIFGEQMKFTKRVPITGKMDEEALQLARERREKQRMFHEYFIGY